MGRGGVQRDVAAHVAPCISCSRSSQHRGLHARPCCSEAHEQVESKHTRGKVVVRIRAAADRAEE